MPPNETPALTPDESAPAAVPRAEAWRFWFKLGFISFGGPAGQIALMHAELVERRRWISEARFLHALNYCMLLPGPEAQQLATYLGWLMHRSAGGIVAGVLFVLPSLLLLIALSALYMAHGQQPLVAAVFAAIKPAVVAIVAQAARRIGRRTLTNAWRAALALAAFAALLLHLPFPWIVAGAALIGWALSRWKPQALATSAGHGAPRPAGSNANPAGPAPAPRALIDDDTPTPAHARFSRARLAAVLGAGLLLWALPMAGLLAWAGPQGPFTQMAWFFTQAALLTFGGAYAVLPFVHQGAVVTHGWLSAAQMMDGLALGETTPGPLIMVVAFVAFVGGWQHPAVAALLGPGHALLGGTLAAVLVTWFTFLPSFVFILAGGPLVEQTHGRIGFTAPLAAIGAAVVGVIAHLAVFFAGQVLWADHGSGGFDLRAALIGLAAALALFVARRSVIEVIAAAALLGLLLGALGL